MARTKTLTPEQSAHVRAAIEKLCCNYSTQGELARALGVSAQTVSSALRGRGVGLGIVLGVAKLLNVSVDDVLAGIDPTPEDAPPVRAQPHALRAPRALRFHDSEMANALEQAFDSSKHLLRDSEGVRRALRATFRRSDLEGDLPAAAGRCLDAAAQLRIGGHPITAEALLLVAVGLRLKARAPGKDVEGNRPASG